jgi:hypothetical protein
VAQLSKKLVTRDTRGRGGRLPLFTSCLEEVFSETQIQCRELLFITAVVIMLEPGCPTYRAPRNPDFLARTSFCQRTLAEWASCFHEHSRVNGYDRRYRTGDFVLFSPVLTSTALLCTVFTKIGHFDHAVYLTYEQQYMQATQERKGTLNWSAYSSWF